MGYQYVLSPGEYPDYQYWLGINDAVRSCRIIRHVGNSWRMKVWEKPNFEGDSMELADNMPTFQERWQNRDIHSCKVFEGAWIFYEQPNYRGRQYLLEKGEYRRFSEWGGVQPRVGSIRRLRNQYVPFDEISRIMERTGKIFFYEDKNFQGHSYECSSDCAELSSHFSRCNSIRVEGGSWVIYERPQYMGYQYVLMRGEYPTYQSWNGFNDTIRSCRLIRYPPSRHRIRIYERPDFSGQMIELSEDLANLQDRWGYRDVHSAHVQDGIWIFYENPNYKGRQYLLEKGEYRRHSEWGALQPSVGSIRRAVDY
ncbi:gamma-crystallin M2-like [Xenentodon cancila]